MLKISVDCQECGKTIVKDINFMTNAEEVSVPLGMFEHMEWFCEDCEITWLTGDLELINEADL